MSLRRLVSLSLRRFLRSGLRIVRSLRSEFFKFFFFFIFGGSLMYVVELKKVFEV